MYDHKQILILSFPAPAQAPRVYRQIMFLKDSYRVTVSGPGQLQIEGVDFIPLAPTQLQNVRDKLVRKILRIVRLKTRQFDAYYWSIPEVREAYQKLCNIPYALITAHDLYTLPLAISLARTAGAKVLLDAHEYTPREFDDVWSFRFLYQAYWDYICQTYFPRTNAMVTISPGIATEYTRNYGISCHVVTNAPFYENLTPSDVDARHIRLIYHGGFQPSRRIENMIRLMEHLNERFYLDLMLVSSNPDDTGYLRTLQELATHFPRIKFRDPVPMPEIARATNAYDMGIFLLWPSAYNYKMALPNKLFEFIQARLGIAIWPSPEMARLVQKYHCGVVAEDFTIEAMAAQLNALSEADIYRYKEQSHQAARMLSAERNQHILLDIVADLIGR